MNMQILVVPSKGSSCIDLHTEYNHSMCLFRIAGDRFMNSGAGGSGLSGGDEGARGDASKTRAGDDFLADFGVSRKVFSRTLGVRASTSNKGEDMGSAKKAPSDSLSGATSTSSSSSQPQQGPRGSASLIAEGELHKSTSYIITRCRELAADNHFGNYKW